MKKSPLFSLLSFAITASAYEAPSICMLSPLATAAAGDFITASIDNLQGKRCQANLVFSDVDFLPVNFVFQPVTCLGIQRANISIPMEVPNGVATVIWECSGGDTQSCARLSIEGGSGDLDTLVTQQSGIIECLVATTTFTTLVTSVISSSTTLKAVVSTEFSTSVVPTSSPAPAQVPPVVVGETLSSSSYTASSTSSDMSTTSSDMSTTSSDMSKTSDMSTTSSTTTTECSCSTSQTPTVSNNGSPFN